MSTKKVPGSGRKKGTPNKATAELKDMILGALSDAGGRKYLLKQSIMNPGAFMTLVGKVLPLAVSGPDGQPLVVTLQASDAEL